MKLYYIQVRKIIMRQTCLYDFFTSNHFVEERWVSTVSEHLCGRTE